MSKTTQAVVLAAGRGTRLGTRGDGRPKCLTDVGGKPLLFHSLAALGEAGVEKTWIITGHRADQLRSAVGDSLSGMDIRYASNPDYRTSGSLGSLLVASRVVERRSTLLLESDLLYDPRFLAVAQTDCADDTLLVADVSHSGDEVFVTADETGALRFLGKAASASTRQQSCGEFAGITRLSPAFLERFARGAQRWRAAGRQDAHYEELILELGAGSFQVRACPGLAWGELDTEADLVRLQNVVWPALGRDAGDTEAAADARA